MSNENNEEYIVHEVQECEINLKPDTRLFDISDIHIAEHAGTVKLSYLA